MIYQNKTPVITSVINLLIVILVASKTNPLTPWRMEILGIILILLGLSLFFINYQVKLDKDTLQYTVNFHKIQIIKRDITPSQISEIVFKRYGWGKKGAVIKVAGKLNIRIVDFHPQEIYDKLIEFANNNHLKMHKTKDYQILER